MIAMFQNDTTDYEPIIGSWARHKEVTISSSVTNEITTYIH